MKTKTLLIAAVMFLGLSAAAFAQATFQVGSIPVTTVTATGNTEKVGDITFTQLSGTSNAGTINISYGTNVIITVPFTVPTVGSFTGGCYTLANTTVNTSASIFNPGLLVINIPAGCTTGSFTVTGVRVKISGTGINTLAASISTTNNAILGGQTNPTVVTSVANAIGAVAGPTSPTTEIRVNAVTGIASPTSTIVTVKENFLAAFAQSGGIKVVLSKAPPAGTTLTFGATATVDLSGGGWSIGNSAGTATTSAKNVTSASSGDGLVGYYYLTTPGAANDTNLDTLTITISESGAPTAAQLPLDLTPITCQVSLAPIKAALDTSVTPNVPYSSPIPRYDELLVAGPTIMTISGSRSALMAEFATVGGGFDTGIAITNTTEDPGATALGGGGAAVAQAGTITFYLFPSTGTNPTAYTTSTSSPNAATLLDSSGRLPAGGTYKVLLSQLLAAVGAPSTFDGYIIAVCNFTHGHGMYVLSNFTTWGQSATFRVLTDRATPEK